MNYKKKFKQRQKKLEDAVIDWAFLGEGSKQGVAYWYAEQHPREKIVIVDLKSPEYNLLPNLKFVTMDAFLWLENYPQGKIQNVRDDFAFHHLALGDLNIGLLLDSSKRNEINKVIQYSRQMVQRVRHYFSLIHQALTSTGTFYLTNSDNGDGLKDILQKELHSLHFNPTLKFLTEDQIKNESYQAKQCYREGFNIYRIIASKQ